jgi:hypothetical protein
MCQPRLFAYHFGVYLCTALNFVELFHFRNMHDVLSLDFKQPTINRLKGCILHLCH